MVGWRKKVFFNFLFNIVFLVAKMDPNDPYYCYPDIANALPCKSKSSNDAM